MKWIILILSSFSNSYYILAQDINNLLDKNRMFTFIIANSTIACISISTIFGTYFYDWLHGQHRLQKNKK